MLSRQTVALAAALAGALAASAAARSPFMYGHAAYTYGPLHCAKDPCAVVPSCNHAGWADDIAAYNKMSSDDSKISVVYAYGGDIEFWPNKDDPQGCWAPASTDPNVCNTTSFYDPVNRKAAAVYREASGVQGIVALLDGRMDGWDQIQTYNGLDACQFGDFYPDLRNLTDAGLRTLAQQTAKLYCQDDNVAGVQVDLEPYRDPYSDAMDTFMGYFAKDMLDEDGSNGCRNDVWPNGRSASYFTFAHSQSTQFTQLLGPNGYYVFSGYDLWPKTSPDTFLYNNVTEFGQKLRREINYMRPVVGTTGKFTLAIPIAASCHEYEQYIPMKGDGCGPACEGWTNTAKMQDYVQEAFNVLLSEEVTNATGGLFCMNETAASQFLGLSLWTWTYSMTYPPMKWFSNDFMPPTPSDETLEILRANLPKFSDGTTCLKGPNCSSQYNRVNGCTCEHSWQCASQWCTGTCADPSADQLAPATAEQQ